MSRSFGVSSFTSLPPIRRMPLVMSSSPATIRSAVVLPQPDGPTSTMNSPSPTFRVMSLTAWKPFSEALSSLSMLTSAMLPPYRARARARGMRSSLHRARGQAGDHELAEDEDQDADGHHRHHAGGEDRPEWDLQRGAERGDADRDGL